MKATVMPQDVFLWCVHQFGDTYVITWRYADETFDICGNSEDVEKAFKHKARVLTKAEVMAKHDVPERHYNAFDDGKFFSVFFAEYSKPLRLVVMSRQDYFSYIGEKDSNPIHEVKIQKHGN